MTPTEAVDVLLAAYFAGLVLSLFLKWVAEWQATLRSRVGG